MAKYLVDTDILIDFFRGNEQAKAFIRSNFDSIILSSITVAELYAGVREGDERTNLNEFIELVPVVSVTDEIAVQGGLLKKDYARSHGTGLADAIIAATAQTCDAILCTLNRKHFPMIQDLKIPYTK
ncbi:PIN domain-containing protein [Candidatus Electrothrix sp.]|uniref:PIN domain-containing protein n=1 Tax=Candidatus Electrothrix sp. TaxID=2170559 RepID=UPI004056B908